MSVQAQFSALSSESIIETIQRLIDNLVKINDNSGEFLLHLDDGRVIDTKGWHGWDWTHGIGLYGLYRLHKLTDSPGAYDIIQDWFGVQLANGTTKNINTMAAMLTLAYTYEETGQPQYRPVLQEWAEWAMHDLPRTTSGGMQHVTYDLVNEQELWDDTLMMTVMPLAKIGMLLGRQDYVEEAKRQFLVHIKYLLDPRTGLFYHGWKFDTAAPGGIGHNFGNARWARGNSWLTIAIPEFIELIGLARTDALFLHLTETLEMQCTALQRLQRPDGMWLTLLDQPEELGSYPEASATAGFAYGILKAVRMGYVPDKFLPTARKAVDAVMARISGTGELRDVSFGTAVGKDLQHYFDIPRTSMPYGQAMAIMMLGEVLTQSMG